MTWPGVTIGTRRITRPPVDVWESRAVLIRQAVSTRPDLVPIGSNVDLLDAAHRTSGCLSDWNHQGYPLDVDTEWRHAGAVEAALAAGATLEHHEAAQGGLSWECVYRALDNP